MYIAPKRRQRRSSPIRVLFLLMLISAFAYVYAMVQQENIERPFVVTPTPTRSALSHVYEAEDLYLAGNLGEAIVAYERALSLNPGDVLIYIPLARLLALEGRPVQAVQRGNEAVGMAPENARAWAVLGMAYDWSGDIPDAIDACKRAVELDPTYAEGYAYLAEAYADAVLWDDALEAAQIALQLDDRSADVHRNYGYVLEGQGDYLGAMRAYEKALEINPNLPHIHIAIGRYQRGMGDRDGAIARFKRAADMDPSNAEALTELGWTYHEIGEFDVAETYLVQATEAGPEFGPAFGRLAINYWARRNYEDAIPNFERAIRLSSIAARQMASGFSLTMSEDDQGGPASSIAMQGDFESTSAGSRDTLRAELIPVDESDQAWANARGTVVFQTRTGKYSISLTGVPRPRFGQMYLGWIEGVSTLSGDAASTGRLQLALSGEFETELEVKWVDGPRIEYLYTLGLAYFYLDDCAKSYPLFDAALQIDPEEANALEGIRLCRAADAD